MNSDKQFKALSKKITSLLNKTKKFLVRLDKQELVRQKRKETLKLKNDQARKLFSLKFSQKLQLQDITNKKQQIAMKKEQRIKIKQLKQQQKQEKLELKQKYSQPIIVIEQPVIEIIEQPVVEQPVIEIIEQPVIEIIEQPVIEIIKQECNVCSDDQCNLTKCPQCPYLMCDICLSGIQQNSRNCPNCRHQCELYGNFREFVQETNQRLFQEIVDSSSNLVQFQVPYIVYSDNQNFERLLNSINLQLSQQDYDSLFIEFLQVTSLNDYEQFIQFRERLENFEQIIEQQQITEQLYQVIEYQSHILEEEYVVEESVIDILEESVIDILEESVFEQESIINMIDENQQENQLESILQEIQNTNNDIVIEAFAGCGKTFALRQIANLLADGKKQIAYIVFNKKNQAEAQSYKEFKNTTVFTFNSFGSKQLQGSKYDTNKLVKIARKNHLYMALDQTTKKQTIQIIEHIKQNNTDYSQHEKVIQEIIQACIEDVQTIDFLDDLFIPVQLQQLNTKYDVILCDEIQDFCQLQIDFLKLFKTKQNTRIIAVGDQNQGIYQFRGALDDSIVCLKNMLNQFNPISEKLLTFNYRCDKNIIDYVNTSCLTNLQYKKDLQLENNVQENITEHQIHDIINSLDLSETVMLSQTKKQILFNIEMLVKQNPKILINYNIESIFEQLYQKYEKEQKIKELQEKRIFSKQTLYEQQLYECMRNIFNSLSIQDQTISQVIQQFKQQKGLTFMTIHKSKGLEFQNVIYQDLPKIDDNLDYVAKTRAIKYLYCFHLTKDNIE